MISGIKQEIIFMAVAIEIVYPYHVPTPWKCWPERAADENVVIQIPDRRLVGGGIEKHIVRETVIVKVTCFYQFPAIGKSRPKSTPDEVGPRQIPNSCSIRTCIE